MHPGPRARAVISQEPGPGPCIGEYPEAGWECRGHLAAAHLRTQTLEADMLGNIQTDEHCALYLGSLALRPGLTSSLYDSAFPISPDPTMGADPSPLAD